jgi:hypothetical protein
MRDSKDGTSVDLLESELDNLIKNDSYFESISEEIRKLVHKVFFVHARLESELGMRILFKLLDEQLSANQNTSCCVTETMGELIRKLTYIERLNMVREFKDGVPYNVLEKINRIRNDFGHPIERKWKDKYKNKKSIIEVLQLLVVGIKVMDSYMEKVKEKSKA